MSRVPSPLADLLADCDAQGIRLLLADDGGLTIDAQQDALTPDLLDRLKARKADILLVLCAERDTEAVPEFPYEWDWLESRGLSASAVCPCGSTAWSDVPIHGGQSARRNCAECGRFIKFPVWYGRTYVDST